MTREWQPGDVAMARHGRVFYSGDENRGAWTFDDGSGGFGPNFIPLQPEEPIDTRPLVVIDPEDREQVGRIWQRFAALRLSNVNDYDGISDLQEALEAEFAYSKPPTCSAVLRIGADRVECERDDHDVTLDHRNDSIGQGVRWSA